MTDNTDTPVSNVFITEDILPAYKEYVEAQAAIEAAEAKRNAARARILLFHKENGVDLIKDKGFCSTLSINKRTTLLKSMIEEKFGKLPAECVKTTTYETIRVSGSLITE